MSKRWRLWLCIGFLALAVGAGVLVVLNRPAPDVRVGSKKFTESVILAEMAKFLIEDAGGRVVHREQLGGTQVLWQALLKGDIDIYPEYTGTLRKDILKGPADLEAALKSHGVKMSASLGFSNSYALGMNGEEARRRKIVNISDLNKHPDLRFGFSEEFRNRDDGWGPLNKRYGLRVTEDHVKVLDHEAAYEGLRRNKLDVIDVYTTEGQIRTDDLVVLHDDLHFFPEYQAVWVYWKDLPEPWVKSLERLQGQISEERMLAMNAQALKAPPGERRGIEKRIAAEFLRQQRRLSLTVEEEPLYRYLARLTGEHLLLVTFSLGAAMIVALPLGIIAAKYRLAGQFLLAVTGILQTIPSLALLVILIPLLGIGVAPAIVALFLYSLLPIVRNTHAGLHGISPALRESAAALGLPSPAVLRLVELPLASRSILAGIKTAAVINVGTATLGALIGAGGFGEPILTGIRLNDPHLILQGAVSAAILALLVQGLFELAELTLTPRGLRLTAAV
jgi:osmoprotectant transport system permease protein